MWHKPTQNRCWLIYPGTLKVVMLEDLPYLDMSGVSISGKPPPPQAAPLALAHYGHTMIVTVSEL